MWKKPGRIKSTVLQCHIIHIFHVLIRLKHHFKLTAPPSTRSLGYSFLIPELRYSQSNKHPPAWLAKWDLSGCSPPPNKTSSIGTAVDSNRCGIFIDSERPHQLGSTHWVWLFTDMRKSSSGISAAFAGRRDNATKLKHKINQHCDFIFSVPL